MEKSENYIHDTFIANGPGWIQTTWNWLMGEINQPGWTLVDVVGQVFTGVAGAISKVKNLASQGLNAIKAGLKFIYEYILEEIVDGVVFGLRKMIETVVASFQSLTNKFSYTTTNYGFQLSQGQKIITIDVERLDLLIQLKINGIVYWTLDIFGQMETLGPKDDAVSTIIGINANYLMTYINWMLLLVNIKAPNPLTVGMNIYSMIFNVITMGGWIGMLVKNVRDQDNYTGADREEYTETSKFFHKFLAWTFGIIPVIDYIEGKGVKGLFDNNWKSLGGSLKNLNDLRMLIKLASIGFILQKVSSLTDDANELGVSDTFEKLMIYTFIPNPVIYLLSYLVDRSQSNSEFQVLATIWKILNTVFSLSHMISYLILNDFSIEGLITLPG